jgi:hypothetical protein
MTQGRGHEEAFGVGCEEYLLVTQRGAADQRESTVTVVVVGEVGEGLGSYQKSDVSCVLAAWPLAGLGE